MKCLTLQKPLPRPAPPAVDEGFVMVQLARLRSTVLPEIISAIVVAVSLGWGALLLTQEDHFTGPTFRNTFEWAAPQIWGSVMIGSSIFFGYCVLFQRGFAWLAALPVVALYTGWGLSVVHSYADGGLPPFASVTLAALAAALAWNYWAIHHDGTR